MPTIPTRGPAAPVAPRPRPHPASTAPRPLDVGATDAAAPTAGGAGGAPRLSALDLLRGLLMALMAIDHASYFVGNRHPLEFWGLALPSYDAGATGTAWFLTRFVTHVCAPGFFLLMGASQALHAAERRSAGWSEARIRRYWVTRGLLLIVLQHVVENPAWLIGTLDDPSGTVVPGAGGEVLLHFGVLYGLGVAMIAGAWLLRAPTALLALLAPGAILLTAALVPPASMASAPIDPLRLLLVTPGHTGAWQVFYPALPWTGVAAAGLLLGRALRRAPGRTLRTAPLVGIALLAAFAAVRFAPGPLGALLDVTAPPGTGWLAALAVVKYPPSPAFLLLTLGLVLVLLGGCAALARAGAARGGALVAFGQTALFFYLLHLYVYAGLGLLLPGPHGLAVTYASWAAGLVLLYGACRWYRTVKARRPAESLWRLL